MEFWCLGPPESTKQLASWAKGVEFDGSITCSANPGHIRADKRSSTLSVIVPSDSRRDFIWTWLTECLISDRALTVFNQMGFTGFQTKPATVRTRSGKQLGPYFELLVTGWGGVVPASSGVRLIEECKTCGHKVYSRFINASELVNESSWDRSDFFIVWPLPRYIMVSERVVQTVAQASLTGAVFSKVSHLKVDPDATLTPGNISMWMPEKRAKELRRSLKIS